MKYIIGVDLGTSATKTVLFDESGNAICSDSMEYLLYQPQNGWAEQDADDWYRAGIVTIKNVINKSKVDKNDIVSIGISGQMHGLVMLDEDCNVLRKSIIWCDQRTSKECEELTQKLTREKIIEITANPALTGFTASKILWVKNNEPEIFNKCRHILLPKDYLRFKLTGDFATEVSDASGMQLLDVPNRQWSDVMIEAVGIKKEYLPKVYESSDVTGHINEEAAKLTGLSENTLVVGGAGDNAAAAVGMGVVEDDKAFTSVGTSGVVFAHTKTPIIDLNGRVHTFCCAVPGEWHVMGVTQAAGLSFRWARDNLTDLTDNKDAYNIMQDMAEMSGIGANRLIYLPYLMGERTPHLNPDARGVFFGLSAMHGKGDMIRAVLEGVCYSLKDCLAVLNEMNINPEEMLICGGGAKGNLWRQMFADVYKMKISRVVSDEGPALGVAILALVGAGIYPDVKTACKEIIKYKEPENYNANSNKKYNEVYEVYKKVYGDLVSSFDMLSKI